MTLSIDLNADLGESFGPWPMGHDAAMLEIVTSANIACGFHAGDPATMAETVKLCRANGVGVGAHPGFDDLRGFGRRRIVGTPPAEMRAMVIYQIGALQSIARTEDMAVTHVKLHGALYNMCSADLDLARLCIGAAHAAAPDAVIVAGPGTAQERAAADLTAGFAREVFADRGYNDDGTLAARGTPGAMIHDPDEAADRVLRMVEERAVRSVNGVRVPVEPETVCVHGDDPGAVRLAARLREVLERAGVTIRGLATRRLADLDTA